MKSCSAGSVKPDRQAPPFTASFVPPPPSHWVGDHVSPITRPFVLCRVPRAAALFRVALVSLLVLLAAAAALAQTKKDPELKTVHGSVVDKSENPVPSSVVYLKNLGTQAVRTYISDSAGSYRFSGLDPNMDYEIHAEHDNDCSPPRNLSNFDSRRDIEYVLKLTKTNCRK
jgi:hypothetical protein